MLFDKENRVLAGTTELVDTPAAIEIRPPLEVHNTVQYVALAIEGASKWRRGSEPGELLTGEGRRVAIRVELEAESGRRYVLDDASFGKDLMFSHVAADTPAGASDLPATERFVRLWLRADPPVTATQVRWSDITNK